MVDRFPVLILCLLCERVTLLHLNNATLLAWEQLPQPRLWFRNARFYLQGTSALAMKILCGVEVQELKRQSEDSSTQVSVSDIRQETAKVRAAYIGK